MPPAMLISLVENVLKHGLEGWPHPGTVRIEAALEDDLLALRVHDDGAGFGGSAARGPGLGLLNILDRLDLLYGGAATLDVAAGESGGVIAGLRLPLTMPATQPGA
jgi:LytS/YehU family sensor histidine kinase